MTVLESISDYLQPATLEYSVADALSLALEEGLQTVPVVDDDDILVAIVRLPDLVSAGDSKTPLRDIRLHPPIVVGADAHLFDAVQLVVDNEVDLLPVVDDGGHYLGALNLTSLVRSVSLHLGLAEEGSVIEIDVAPRDYTLGRLVHTIEEHDIRIMSINSDGPHGEDNDIRVTVKVGAGDTVRVKAVLEHYGYKVVAVDRRRSNAEDIQHRVREFMHYLDV